MFSRKDGITKEAIQARLDLGENLALCSRAEHMTIHKDLEQIAMEMVRDGRIICAVPSCAVPFLFNAVWHVKSRFLREKFRVVHPCL